jgi:glycosyltransferase involved in cell wall biosynthesis
VPRIGLNLLYLAPGETGGMETYARGLVPELVHAWPEATFVAFAGRELGAELRERPWAPGLATVVLPVSARTRLPRSLAEQATLPVAVRRARIDLLHSLGTTTPLGPGAPAVVTIHDLIYQRFPETHAGVLARGMSVLVPLAARRARRIVAVSHATGDDLVRYLGTDPARIDVVHSGPGLAVGPATPERELRERLGLPAGPLLVSPSAHRPHKNLGRLLEAMEAVSQPATLVVPGYGSAFEGELAAQAERLGVSGRVVFSGWLADPDLEGLYRAARAIVFPSLWEGFGLPVLEAMQRGIPVACSNVSALQEVAGDAALQFDPLRPPDIAAAITRLLVDPDLREELVRRGHRRVAEFSWARTARETVASYRRALG